MEHEFGELYSTVHMGFSNKKEAEKTLKENETIFDYRGHWWIEECDIDHD